LGWGIGFFCNIKPKNTKYHGVSSLSVNPSAHHIVGKIIALRDDSKQHTPRGLAEKLLQEGKKHFPAMGMNMINMLLEK
jgi:hypothetical protein